MTTNISFNKLARCHHHHCILTLILSFPLFAGLRTHHEKHQNLQKTYYNVHLYYQSLSPPEKPLMSSTTPKITTIIFKDTTANYNYFTDKYYQY